MVFVHLFSKLFYAQRFTLCTNHDSWIYTLFLENQEEHLLIICEFRLSKESVLLIHTGSNSLESLSDNDRKQANVFL